MPTAADPSTTRLTVAPEDSTAIIAGIVDDDNGGNSCSPHVKCFGHTVTVLKAQTHEKAELGDGLRKLLVIVLRRDASTLRKGAKIERAVGVLPGDPSDRRRRDPCAHARCMARTRHPDPTIRVSASARSIAASTVTAATTVTIPVIMTGMRPRPGSPRTQDNAALVRLEWRLGVRHRGVRQRPLRAVSRGYVPRMVGSARRPLSVRVLSDQSASGQPTRCLPLPR